VVREGTAATAFCDNPYRARIWGKTGSSERPGPDGGHVTDSWFVGVIEPPDADLDTRDRTRHPVAVACVVPGAGLGGTHAAEVADRLMRDVARSRGWELAPGP
jgi:cell division protein FtsI/penicillin-binding protein 2